MRKKPSLLLQILFVIFCVVLGWTLIIPFVAVLTACEVIFNSRVNTTRKILSVDDYKGLKKYPTSFKSRGNKINAAFYTNEEFYDKKALLILSHGIGCGMNNYLNRIDYFARKGYLVFAFDMTGSCESKGSSINGLPQSVVDIKNALIYLKTVDEIKGMKKLLYGHSWSGYGSATVLNFKEAQDLDAVASLSGFNNAWDITARQGYRYIGKLMILLKPWFNLYQLIKFGKAGVVNAIQGINKYNKPVLVEHSEDDPTVSFEVSIYNQKDKCTNKKAIFNKYENRGHTLSRPLEVEKKINQSLINAPEPPKKKPGENIFQYNVDIHYDYVDKETTFAIDEEYMDHINEFFEKVLKEENN